MNERIRVIKILILFLFLCLPCLPLSGETPFIPFTPDKWRFDYITSHDGLSQNTLTCILQDSRGFMWFGTQDGLNRYDGYNFKVYVNEPDVPGSIINNGIAALCESRFRPGILWVGTSQGLYTLNFETEKFAVVGTSSPCHQQLQNSLIRAIIEDNQGFIWIGTASDGLFKYDPHHDRLDHYPLTFPLESKPFAGKFPVGKVNSKKLSALIKDQQGNILIGSEEGGLFLLNKKSRALQHFSELTGKQHQWAEGWIRALLCDRNGDIWVGSDGYGLVRIHGPINGKETLSIYSQNSQDSMRLLDDYVRVLYQDKAGSIWIGTVSGSILRLPYETEPGNKTPQFFRYLDNTESFDHFPKSDIQAILEDRAGTIWIGTRLAGIKIMNANLGNFFTFRHEPKTPNGLNHNVIWAFLQGKDGQIWVGTDGGLYRFDLQSRRFHHVNYGSLHPGHQDYSHVFCLHEDKNGTMWIGTDNSGLYKYDRSVASDTFTNYRYDIHDPTSIANNYIRCVLEDSRGVLWIGLLDGGLCCVYPQDREKMKFTRFYNIPGDPSSLSNNHTYAIHEDSTGAIWVATLGGGVNRFWRETNTFTHFRKQSGAKNSVNDDRILSLHSDRQGLLWVGTSSGLNIYDIQANHWQHYTTRDGLTNNVIYAILEENPMPGKKSGNIWVSTNKGLSRFNRQTRQFHNYDRFDGLQSNEFNIGASAKTREGLMLFGGINGFNLFDPAAIKDNLYVPPVVLTDFKLFNQTVAIEPRAGSPLRRSPTATRRLHLTYRQHSFSFEFAALNFINPEKNLYQYMLVGFDRDWTPLRKRLPVSYTNIPPGKYIFRAKGSNNDGIWNERGIAVDIIISPPFWGTWWFQLLGTLLLVGLLAFMHRQRTNRLRQKFEKQQLEKEMKLKADFTAMLVHDLRNPLTVIIGYADMLSEIPDAVDIPKIGSAIARSSDHMVSLINDMLDLAKFEAGKMILNRKKTRLAELVTRLVEISRPLMDRRQIQLLWNQETAATAPEINIDPDRIGQVIANLLSNATKFTPEHGTISIFFCRVDFRSAGCFQELSVTDDGPGVPPEERPHLFNKYSQLHTTAHLQTKGTGLGLAVSKLIIESHQGTIGFTPRLDGKGSTFFFRLPEEQNKL